MTDKNKYDELQNEYSFDTIKELVNNLPTEIKKHAPEIHNEKVEGGIESILRDLTFDQLNRQGIRTRRDSVYVTYKYERPDTVKVRISAIYDSDKGELDETLVHTVLDEYPDSEIIDFRVQPDARITIN